MSTEDGAAFLVAPPKKDKDVVALSFGAGEKPLTADTMDAAVAATREIFILIFKESPQRASDGPNY